MMVKFEFWKLFIALFQLILGISASTHWVVTENGRIQSQLDSMFHMRRPYDLLSLLEQEKRVKAIEELHNELMTRKSSIDQQWGTLEGAADLESRLYSQDPDCLKAGHTLADTDLYISLIGDIRERVKLENYLVSCEGGVPELPDCSAVIDLDFSMTSFEHLQVMVKRANLSTCPELSLASFVLEDQDMAQFAHQVALGLQRNSTSWLHHNLAAVYWRIRGNAPNAVECARRAVHFAPRQYKDLALLTLGGLLQQAKALVEAALVLHAAVDHAPHVPQNHLALGTVYAILGDYNRSVACLDNALKLLPSLETASKLKHTVKCHHKLEQGLLDLHQSLQSMLGELQEYHARQERWLQLQERLRREQAPLEMRLLDQDPALLSLLRGPSCVQQLPDGSQSSRSCEHIGLGTFPWQAHSLQLLLRKVESRAKKISEQMLRHNPLVQEQSVLESSQSAASEGEEPVSMEDGRQVGDGGVKEEAAVDEALVTPPEAQSWPSQEECTAYKGQFPVIQDLSSVFLAPEDRGFEAHLYLGPLIGLGSGEEHVLPWYPPTCSAAEVSHEPLVQRLFPRLVPQHPEPAPELQLLPELLKYGVQGQAVEAEIGQRILSAINKDVGPRWLLHSLAALYWRVRGNLRHALDCLRVAVAAAPARLADVPLVSLGALLLRAGQLPAARRAALHALAVDDRQVISHFLLGLVLEAQSNHSGAIHHLKKVLEIQPNYLGGQARNLLRAAACREQFSNTPLTDEPSSEEMCGTGKPMDLLSSLEGMREGDTVVCSVDGQQCHTMQCFSPGQNSGGLMTLDAATVARLLGPGNSQCAGEDVLDQPDETELERMGDPSSLPKHFRLRIALGDDELQSSNLGEFYVPVALMDNAWLRVYDKSGTYALSPSECERIHSIDWGQETAIWLSSSGGGIIVESLPIIPSGSNINGQQPECDRTLPPSHLTLDHLAGVRLRHRLQASAESGLRLWLAAALGDPSSKPSEMAVRLALALQENATSWVLATAAALYWRIVGRADQAVTCLRQALQYAPSTERNIPLVSLASVLSRAGFNSDALVVANMALDLAPKFFVAHFTIANIHASMGDLEKAITFYRSSLELEPNFEPARNRLLGILCSVLFEEHSKQDE
ncbi:hypothetical protein R5R35_014291 [Gryllus longicercus]|uniref:Tetratricopeptide repeat protein 17 n=1 Tax=Gryllus longicercus TaxID=2509291 RepID=A0AAN9ZG87_9ORTH